MNPARHRHDQKNIHHRATEALRKPKSKANWSTPRWRRPRRRTVPEGLGVRVASVGENPRGAPRFQRLVTQTNTDKKGLGFIGVHLCSSVAKNVLPVNLSTVVL